MNRVVITGMGIYSCIGKNLEEVKESLFLGRSGIGFIPERKEIGFRSALSGIIEKPNLKGLIERRLRVGMAEQGEYAYLSTLEAMKNAGLDADFFLNNEVGILFGNDSSSKAVIESTDIVREKKDTMLLGSGYIFQAMNSTVSMNLSVIFKLRGINFTISAACASGSHAIGMGYLFIKQGMQDMVICGGAQEVNPFSMGSFDALSAFSVREDEPQKASRPFDKNRDGLIPSGGAATVILESYESAVRRGAPILGEIIGYGFSSNGEHISQSSVDGLLRAMNRSFKDAAISHEQIDYINAHATSTPNGDANEAAAIDQIFGSYKVPVSSTKSMTGHECWMAGASEIVYSTLMMQHSFIAPNINFEEPDIYSEKINIINKTKETDFDIFLSNSFGFGGTNSSLIVKKLK
jgi:3-oxoacyl-[acyl-carrier-protein] synthase-1